jgi:hypothetical protein
MFWKLLIAFVGAPVGLYAVWFVADRIKERYFPSSNE